jgi:hypothetical protein
MVFQTKVWIFGFSIFMLLLGLLYALILQVRVQHYVQRYYSCFKLHIEHSMLLSSCSLSFCLCVNINYTFGHKK